MENAILKESRPGRAHVFHGWRMVAAFWLVSFVNLGFTTYGSGILNTAMAEALGFDARQLGLFFSIFLLMLGLPSPLVGLVIARFGLRAAIATGSIMVVAAATALATVVRSAPAAALAFGLVMGAGVAFSGAIPGQVGVGRWFVRRRALALSIMLSANGVGGLVSAPLLNHAAATGGWRSGWAIIAVLSALVATVAVLVIRDSPDAVGQVPDGPALDVRKAPRVHVSSASFTARQATRTRTFWLLAGASIANCVALSLALSHGVANLRSLGHAPREAALAVSLLSGATLVGKMALGALGDRIEPRRIWMLSSLLTALGLASAPFAASLPGLIAYAGLFGIGFGGALVMQGATLMNDFGVKPFPALISLVLFLQTLVGAIVPLGAGYLYGMFGGYGPVFLGAAAIAALAVPALAFATPPIAPSET